MKQMTIKQRQWVTKLQHLLDNAPDDVWLFVASNTLNVMKKNNGQRVLSKNGGMDQGQLLAVITGVEVDGGDW
jgi:hypothetical protein